jgi:hypothetical protein
LIDIAVLWVEANCSTGYTTWVNLLDYTAAVLPVTTCDKNIDVLDEAYVAKSEEDDMIQKTCKFM